MKRVTSLVLVVMLVVSLFTFVGCEWLENLDFSFEGRCKTSEEGFVYYLDPDIGLCIIELPDKEEVVIPEYIDGHKVVQFGYEDIGIGYSNSYVVDGSHVKKLTISSYVKQIDNVGFSIWFKNLEKLIFLDIINYLIDGTLEWREEIDIPFCVGDRSLNVPIVELRKSDREFNMADFKAKVILLPEYVEVIEAGVFDGLEGVTIKTSYTSQPEGWQDGWNGNCKVEWGVDVG